MSDTATATQPTEQPPNESAAGDRQQDGITSAFRHFLRATEIEPRMLGMVGALGVIWAFFHVLSGGTFLTARNLWFLSLQTAVVGIMATGMVLVIVTRNIDLSVGSLLGAIGMAVGWLQTEVLADWLGVGHWSIWLIAIGAGLAIGAAVGALQGAIIAYVGVPSFIVTLGGLLIWRGVAWHFTNGRTVAPMDRTFQVLGGGARGSIGAGLSWVVGLIACVAIIAVILNGRRQRRRFEFPLRPMWAEVLLGVVGCGAVLSGVYVLNQYFKPETLTDGVSGIAFGIAYPVLILGGVALIMTFIATRTLFGRYVYAIGGNPEAAELGGINTKLMTVRTFMVMGILVAVAAIVQVARLNAATNELGTTAELYVIAAAVIGGTSFAGGIGTVSGAVLGALVMQSLTSGMQLMDYSSATQDIVSGVVLAIAVAIDGLYRRRVTR